MVYVFDNHEYYEVTRSCMHNKVWRWKVWGTECPRQKKRENCYDVLNELIELLFNYLSELSGLDLILGLSNIKCFALLFDRLITPLARLPQICIRT